MLLNSKNGNSFKSIQIHVCIKYTASYKYSDRLYLHFISLNSKYFLTKQLMKKLAFVVLSY